MSDDPEQADGSVLNSIAAVVEFASGLAALTFLGSAVGGYYYWPGRTSYILIATAIGCMFICSWLHKLAESLRVIHQAKEQLVAATEFVKDRAPVAMAAVAEKVRSISPPKEEQRIKTKVVGVSHQNRDGSDRQTLIARHIKPGCWFVLEHEVDNPRDPNAMAVYVGASGAFGRDRRYQIGYLRAALAADVLREIELGRQAIVSLLQVTGGDDGEQLGVNIEIELR